MLKRTLFVITCFSIIVNSTYVVAGSDIVFNSRSDDTRLSTSPPEYIILLILIACNTEIVVDASFDRNVNVPTQIKLYDSKGILVESTVIQNGEDQRITFEGNYSGAYRIDALLNGVVIDSKSFLISSRK